jgi:hypothetical protein
MPAEGVLHHCLFLDKLLGRLNGSGYYADETAILINGKFFDIKRYVSKDGAGLVQKNALVY